MDDDPELNQLEDDVHRAEINDENAQRLATDTAETLQRAKRALAIARQSKGRRRYLRGLVIIPGAILTGVETLKAVAAHKAVAIGSATVVAVGGFGAAVAIEHVPLHPDRDHVATAELPTRLSAPSAYRVTPRPHRHQSKAAITAAPKPRRRRPPRSRPAPAPDPAPAASLTTDDLPVQQPAHTVCVKIAVPPLGKVRLLCP